MAYKIQFTKRFLADLAEISTYSDKHFPGGSEKALPSLVNHIELLASYPRLGSKASFNSPLRILIHSPFKIYYKVIEPQQRIDILHIWHGSRRPPKIS
jgi:plasmid stabilization system protein ParE